MKKHFNIPKNRITTLIMALSMTFLLTGCNTEVANFARNDMVDALNQRFSDNQAILDSLLAAQFITPEVHEKYSKNIANLRAATIVTENGELKISILVNESNGELEKNNTIPKAISAVKPIESTGTYDTYGTGDSEYDTSITLNSISNYIMSCKAYNLVADADEWEDYDEFGEWVDLYEESETSGSRKPINIVDDDVFDLDGLLDYDVYVLDSSIVTADGSGGIDGVIEMIQQHVTPTGEIIDVTKLNNYFVEATYSQDTELTGMDGNTIEKEKGDAVKLKDLLSLSDTIIESQSYPFDEVPEGPDGQTGNRPGYDLVSQQTLSGDSEAVIKLKFHEFNKDVIDRLMIVAGVDSNSGAATGKWLFYTGDGLNRVYLMEYPVYYISGFQDSADPNYSEAVLQRSDLGVNLYNGNVVVYEYDDNDNIISSSVVVNVNEDPYLTMKGASGINSASKSAFVISGISSVNLSNDFGTGDIDININTGRIVLRDYLEATYAPSFKLSEGENLVVFGRKIRFTNLLTDNVDFISSIQTSQEVEPYITESTVNGEIISDISRLRHEWTEENILADQAAFEEKFDHIDSEDYEANWIFGTEVEDIVNYIMRPNNQYRRTVKFIVNVTDLINWLYENPNATQWEVKNWIIDHYVKFEDVDPDADDAANKLKEITTDMSNKNWKAMRNISSIIADMDDDGDGVADDGEWGANYINLVMEQLQNNNGNISTAEAFWEAAKALGMSSIPPWIYNILGPEVMDDGYTPSSSKINEDYNGTYARAGDAYHSLSGTVPLGIGSLSLDSQTIIKFDKDNYCAMFVDQEGNPIADTPKLYVNDFCDVNALVSNSYDPFIARPTAKGETASSGEPVDISSESANGLGWESTGQYIQIATRFPGTTIGKADYTRDKQRISSSSTNISTHQTFYAVATTADLFTTGLFSSWVNSSDPEASLAWWREWLSSNGYIYSIDSTSLEEYLYTNYKYELAQNDIVILDLEVVAKIQEEMDKEATEGTNRLIRTIFKIFGWLLIIYAVVLMLCWLIDTNIDVGVQLVNKLTFGQIVPVKYESDVPMLDAEKRHYVALSGMAVRCLVLITVGLLLIMVDVFNIALFLIKTFGQLAEKISEMLTGIQ